MWTVSSGSFSRRDARNVHTRLKNIFPGCSSGSHHDRDAACNKSNANGNSAQAASESGKIPITTKSDEARKEFVQGRDLFERLQATESLEHFDKAIAVLIRTSPPLNWARHLLQYCQGFLRPSDQSGQPGGQGFRRAKNCSFWRLRRAPMATPPSRRTISIN